MDPAPPGRFDFVLDTETFAFFNYQYILYGMGFQTDLSAAAPTSPRRRRPRSSSPRSAALVTAR